MNPEYLEVFVKPCDLLLNNDVFKPLQSNKEYTIKVSTYSLPCCDSKRSFTIPVNTGNVTDPVILVRNTSWNYNEMELVSIMSDKVEYFVNFLAGNCLTPIFHERTDYILWSIGSYDIQAMYHSWKRGLSAGLNYYENSNNKIEKTVERRRL